MTAVAFFNVPAHGHTNPTLPLVHELVRRGTRVTYFTTTTFQTAVEAAGAVFVDIGPLLPPGFDQPDPNHFRLADLLFRGAESVIDALLPELLLAPPDVIVHDSLCPWGQALAQLLGLPSVGSVTTFVLHPRVALTSAALARDVLHMWLRSAEARRSFRATARRLHARYGLRPPSPLGVLSQFGDINVVYTSRELQPAARRLGSEFVFVGPSIQKRPMALDLDLPRDRPLVYVSLGTLLNDVPDFYRTCTAAFEDEHIHVVMAIGSKVRVEDLGALPSNVTVRPSVSQLAVLQQASAFVTHGGMNSVHEALALGVPMLVVPQGADQWLVGERVKSVGAGLRLHRQAVTVQSVRRGVHQLLADDRYRQVAKRVGEDALALGGACRAADVVSSAADVHGQ